MASRITEAGGLLKPKPVILSGPRGGACAYSRIVHQSLAIPRQNNAAMSTLTIFASGSMGKGSEAHIRKPATYFFGLVRACTSEKVEKSTRNLESKKS